MVPILKRICCVGIALSVLYIGVINTEHVWASPTINAESEKKIQDIISTMHKDYRLISDITNFNRRTLTYSRQANETAGDPNYIYFEDTNEYTLEIELDLNTQHVSSHESFKRIDRERFNALD